MTVLKWKLVLTLCEWHGYLAYYYTIFYEKIKKRDNRGLCNVCAMALHQYACSRLKKNCNFKKKILMERRWCCRQVTPQNFALATFNEPAWVRSAISGVAFVDLRLGKQDYTKKLITFQRTTTVLGMRYDKRLDLQGNHFFFRKNCGRIKKITF